MVPRTGFERDNEGELYTTFGTFAQTNDQLNFGGHTQKFAYFASVNANRSNYGLATPGPNVTGGLLAHDANVRADYVTRVGGALTDRGQWSATRAGVRVEARASTSGIGTGIAAMADPAQSGGGGFTATNTRQSVNALAENSGTLGRGLVAVGVTIAVVDVATAPEGQRGQTAAGEAGSLAVGAGGAWAGAELGAAIGSVFPGPGTVVGGIVGSLVGGFFGGQAGHDIGTQAYDDIVH